MKNSTILRLVSSFVSMNTPGMLMMLLVAGSTQARQATVTPMALPSSGATTSTNLAVTTGAYERSYAQLRVSAIRQGTLEVTIYDMLGNPVQRLAGGEVDRAGDLELSVDARELGTGSCTIEAAGGGRRSSTGMSVVR